MADTRQIQVSVITPERQVLAEQADEVVIPAHDGELGVLNLRAPLMCELGIGQLRYMKGGQARRVFIDGGFAQVLENRVVVLTGRALRSEEITDEVVAAADRVVADQQGFAEETRLARERAQQRLAALRRVRGAP